MLGAVATALGLTGADIISVDIVERSPGRAVDDLVVELPNGRPPDVLISAAQSVDGVEVEAIRPFAGALDTHRELALIEDLTERPGDVAALLADAAPRIFRSGWAAVLRPGPMIEAASSAAPELTGLATPWLPLDGPRLLDAEAEWVPPAWERLGTALMVAALGRPDRAILVGRPGGPDFRPSELARLGHLAGIAATIGAVTRPGGLAETRTEGVAG